MDGDLGDGDPKEPEKVIFVSNDQRLRSKPHPVDEKILQQAATGECLITLTPEMLRKLAEAAGRTVDLFKEIVTRIMTTERANYVRHLRVDEGCSWRAVAQACHDEWHPQADDEWGPPSNQLMGMALCEIAAWLLNENFMEEPWN